MSILASTLLVLGVAAGPGPAKAAGHPRTIDELPKAPVEIVLPTVPAKEPAPVSAPPPSKPAAVAKPVGSVRIVISSPSLAKPPVTVPLPPPPALPVPPPASASAPASGPSATAPKGAEVVASTSSAGLPLEQQPGYEVMVQKCGRCHGVEKALNAQLAPDEWDGYLKRKLRKNGAGISPQQAEEIHAFLRNWSARAGQR